MGFVAMTSWCMYSRSRRSTLTGSRLTAGGDSHPYETTVVLRKELEHDLAGEILEAGKHA